MFRFKTLVVLIAVVAMILPACQPAAPKLVSNVLPTVLKDLVVGFPDRF
jgi:hypothetical protein